ncbi:hypothetical protein SERLA73DRAFT_91948 [Serpula lacrymans var. lacrymans S7.3]|uniref:Queuosine 5'-phosphate N-glycosylase/hydrolase n=2 Tax=Serpula lacrymans var. lacrymans TaxID=341189 RepID=F8Q065_SERL3|nr:uncharacterized protein SERLADRAFT_450391 [Serpula lacrymans var. lacrymans S7.9]EGN98537.1 hypothetical protein SERLA73DRAFT_91948 [Serpula lacrymans var. lacrymans S7.3]EGO24107.1 hypothetical protein SERLADRAFT_450391 [Serpula lacrymans var. lacrymans S7.9]
MAAIRVQSSLLDVLYFFSEKAIGWTRPAPVIPTRTVNPVVSSAKFALEETDLVQLNDEGVKVAARYILQKLASESYTPRTWRTHPLHVCPPEVYSSSDPLSKASLDWIFLISSLNFSFWSEREGKPDRYGVEWREGWGKEKRAAHTGYWSLVAALNRALEEDIPITDPTFYSSPVRCPDSVIEYVFRPASQCSETLPLLKERIQIMREVGSILCKRFSGSYQGFIEEFQRTHGNQGTALELVQMVTDVFPSFRDERWYKDRKVYFWKRPQILVAETWAAFYPADPALPHPIFPGTSGPAIHHLTMFADYRVPQILHHLRILVYPSSLVDTLQAGTMLQPGCREEVSLRAASIVAVERVWEEIITLREASMVKYEGEVSSVLIDFYLWDLAKKLESGEEHVEGVETAEITPAHRTRSIWY